LNPYNIYSENLCIKFLEDILNNALKLDLKIIIKMKYNNHGISSKYINYLNKIKKKYKNRILIYHKEISAQSLINISDMVFSLPFSSPSVIGNRMKVKSYYYDPYNIIRHTKYNSKTVTLLNSESQLKKILQTV
jgi:polysaccharide biosynthesis PFTS motif protein